MIKVPVIVDRTDMLAQALGLSWTGSTYEKVRRAYKKSGKHVKPAAPSAYSPRNPRKRSIQFHKGFYSFLTQMRVGDRTSVTVQLARYGIGKKVFQGRLNGTAAFMRMSGKLDRAARFRVETASNEVWVVRVQ